MDKLYNSEGDELQLFPSDVVTTATTTGSGNAVTSVTASNGVLTIEKNSTFLTAHQTVTDNNPSLTWGTKSKVATIGGNEINVTMPANPAHSSGTSSILSTGTDTSDRVWTAKILHDYFAPLASPSFTGTPQVASGTDYTTSRLRNLLFSTSEPSSSVGSNGDICIVYTE